MFEPGTGFLFCERRLKSGTNRSRRDVVVTYGHDAAGQVTVEKWFGGDAQAVSAAAGCVSLPNQPAYSFSHGYSSGVRNLTTTVLADGTQLKILDNDVDPGTGFVSTTREPAAVPAAAAVRAGLPLGRLPVGVERHRQGEEGLDGLVA